MVREETILINCNCFSLARGCTNDIKDLLLCSFSLLIPIRKRWRDKNLVKSVCSHQNIPLQFFFATITASLTLLNKEVKKWKGKVFALDNVRYILKPNTKEVYNIDGTEQIGELLNLNGKQKIKLF